MQQQNNQQIWTPFHISVSGTCGDYQATSFPDRVCLSTEDEVKAAVRSDHVVAELKDCYRKGKNFIETDCLFVDVDNDDRRTEEGMKLWDDQSQHMSIEIFIECFSGYEFVIYTSRNHLKDKVREKDGLETVRQAREKFHVLFPLGREITEYEEVKGYLVDLVASFKRNDGECYFDPALTNPCNLLCGNGDGVEVIWNQGRSILEWIKQYISLEKPETTQGKIAAAAIAVKGDRFSTLVIPKLSIDEVYSEVKGRQGSGSQHQKGLCPFHNDHHPSFAINTGDLSWKCNAGCGSGGVIQYVMMRNGLSYEKAKEQLCKMVGVDLDQVESVKNKSVTDTLVEMAEREKLFHTTEGQAYANVLVNSRQEIKKIPSGEFKQWLKRNYYKEHGKMPGNQTVNDAVDLLEAKAKYDCEESELKLRIAEADDIVYLDLCDDEGSVVEITKDGWTIIKDAPVLFIRKNGMLSLPVPITNGELGSDLKPFLNIKDENDWKLVVGWLLGSMSPRGPYPILVIQGEQGSGKSFMAKILRKIIDPNKVPLRLPPKEERDLMIAANNSWLIAYDNISGLSTATSDALCSLATGGGFATRKLYSDDEEVLFNAARPILINGIEFTTRHDLIDRAILLNLPRITDTERKTEQELWEDFTDMHPYILGALCDAVSSILNNYDSVDLPQKSRMADFETWVTAAESSLKWDVGAFSSAYAENRSTTTSSSIDDDYVAVAVREMLGTSGNNEWSGTATELLKELEKHVDEKVKKNGTLWPQAPNSLSRTLKRITPALRVENINITFGVRRNIDITKDEYE